MRWCSQFGMWVQVGQLELIVGLDPILFRLRVLIDDYRMRVPLVGGASTFIIFNGIATTLCIASCVISLRPTIFFLFMISLQGFDGHKNLVYLYVYDRVRVYVDQYSHDATDRYWTIYHPSFDVADSWSQ